MTVIKWAADIHALNDGDQVVNIFGGDGPYEGIPIQVGGLIDLLVAFPTLTPAQLAEKFELQFPDNEFNDGVADLLVEKAIALLQK
jgi:hypothetical protein